MPAALYAIIRHKALACLALLGVLSAAQTCVLTMRRSRAACCPASAAPLQYMRSSSISHALLQDEAMHRQVCLSHALLQGARLRQRGEAGGLQLRRTAQPCVQCEHRAAQQKAHDQPPAERVAEERAPGGAGAPVVPRQPLRPARQHPLHRLLRATPRPSLKAVGDSRNCYAHAAEMQMWPCTCLSDNNSWWLHGCVGQAICVLVDCSCVRVKGVKHAR